MMTADESDQIEDLLMVWYDHTSAYRPALGAPKVSVSCREYESGDVHESGGDVDDKIDIARAETMDFCIDKLTVPQRSAIGVHCRNKRAGASVWRSARVIGSQHAAYLDAKSALYPHIKKAGLLIDCV